LPSLRTGVIAAEGIGDGKMGFVDIENSGNKYSIIYSDPPWEQRKGGIRKARPNQKRDLDYPSMSLYEINRFHTHILANNTMLKHNVFIWTIDKYLHDTEKIMSPYKLHARFIWDKTNGIAPAFTVRFSHEYLLWFYLPGLMLMPRKECRGKYTTVIREPATIHSKKPAFVYLMLEDMFGKDCPKLELFARNKRDGWDYYGNDKNLTEGD